LCRDARADQNFEKRDDAVDEERGWRLGAWVWYSRLGAGVLNWRLEIRFLNGRLEARVLGHAA